MKPSPAGVSPEGELPRQRKLQRGDPHDVLINRLHVLYFGLCGEHHLTNSVGLVFILPFGHRIMDRSLRLDLRGWNNVDAAIVRRPFAVGYGIVDGCRAQQVGLHPEHEAIQRQNHPHITGERDCLVKR